LISLTLNIDVPTPSRFVKHALVDDIALACNKLYRERNPNQHGASLDPDLFIDLLEVSTAWEDIEEPEHASFFANFSPDNDGLITINKKHGDLFKKRPDVYSACIGHEAGHCLLRHWEKTLRDGEGTLSLFADSLPQPRLFHKSSWFQYGLSREEVEARKKLEKAFTDKLVSKALMSETARQTLNEMSDRFEPEWMFHQAEHFSLCLRIPKDFLLARIENCWDYTSWRGIYRLAECFGVSGSMMKSRLEKLHLIELGSDGKPRACKVPSQRGLF